MSSLLKCLKRQSATLSVILPFIFKLTHEADEAMRSLHRSVAPLQSNSPQMLTVTECSFEAEMFSFRTGQRKATCEFPTMPVISGYTVKDVVDFIADCRVPQIFSQFVGSSPNTFNCRDSKDLFPKKPSFNTLKPLWLSFPQKMSARDFREEFASSPSLTEVANESCIFPSTARL